MVYVVELFVPIQANQRVKDTSECKTSNLRHHLASNFKTTILKHNCFEVTSSFIPWSSLPDSFQQLNTTAKVETD